jgi:hypothetical protein
LLENGGSAEWRNGGMANGNRMAELRNGGMVIEWQNGGMAKWWNRRTWILSVV